MGRNGSAAKGLRRQRKRRTPEEEPAGSAAPYPGRERDLGCALGLGSTLQKEVLQQLNQEAPSRVRHHPAVGLRA